MRRMILVKTIFVLLSFTPTYVFAYETIMVSGDCKWIAENVPGYSTPDRPNTAKSHSEQGSFHIKTPIPAEGGLLTNNDLLTDTASFILSNGPQKLFSPELPNNYSYDDLLNSLTAIYLRCQDGDKVYRKVYKAGRERKRPDNIFMDFSIPEPSDFDAMFEQETEGVGRN